MKQYMSSGINSSPTIAVPAAADMQEIGGKAAKYDADGNLVICGTAGEQAIGIVTIDNDAEIKKGDIVTVQIKDMGLAALGVSVKAGDELTTDASGKFVKAADGQYVRAIAKTTGAENTCVSVILCNYVKYTKTA